MELYERGCRINEFLVPMHFLKGWSECTEGEADHGAGFHFAHEDD